VICPNDLEATAVRWLTDDGMASILDVPNEPTTWLQTFAIFIILFFPALALVVIVVRAAGRLATNQFGLGES